MVVMEQMADVIKNIAFFSTGVVLNHIDQHHLLYDLREAGALIVLRRRLLFYEALLP